MLVAGRYMFTGAAKWGGMSEVHECLDQNLQRKVMLKRIQRVGDFSRLVDEQKALLALRSKHVVQLLDIVEWSPYGTPETGLILEAISGTDLQEGAFAYGHEYLLVVWQIAQGLSDIHAGGVIHRDIKPQNIRLDENGVIKILDFGLSRQVNVDDRTRSIIGTDGYMAPELRPNPRGVIKFTSGIDVYSFAETMLSLIVSQKDQPRLNSEDRVKSILSSADSGLQELVMTALSPSPSLRPKITEFTKEISARLNKDMHRAWLNVNGAIKEINSKARKAAIRSGSDGLEITYDGYRFIATSVSGHVQVNNFPLTLGLEVPPSCVLMLGSPTGSRAFVSFDVSRPEIIV